MLSNALASLVSEIASKDPNGNGLKTGIDLDFKGLVPQSVKAILSACLDKRVWKPTEGITVRSTKPIFPIYQGTTVQGEIHFKFPQSLIINVTKVFLVKHVDIKATDLFVHKELTHARVVIKTWPDIRIEL